MFVSDSEQTDFIDLGGIEYEIEDVKRVLEVKNTTKDKLAYTVSEEMYNI